MLKTFKYFYRFLLAYPQAFTIFALSLLGLGFFGSIQPYFYKLFIDAVPSLNYQYLLKILFSYTAIRLLTLALDLLTYYFGDLIVIKSARDLRLRVVKRIQDLDFAYHTEKSTGSLISAVKRGDSAFFNLFHSQIRVIRVLINFITVLALFSFIRPEIAILLGFSFLINLATTYLLIKNSINKRASFNIQEDEISSIIVDNLINYETVKLFAREKWELSRLKRNFVPWYKKLWGYGNSFRLIDIGIGIPANLSLFLILLFSISQTAKGNFSAGDLALIIGFLTSFYGQMFELLYGLREIAKNFTDLQTYFSVLDEKILIKDSSHPVKKTSVSGEIVFDKVSFSYPNGKENALKNFTLEIRQGESVALVGRSGSGKTTLVKLLMRFYDLAKGKITVDGININKYRKSQLRSFMGVVPQEPILFNNTIAYNIAYGISQVTKKQIIAASKMAYLHDFINTLPQKYETNVGERGIKLSGGQKQRLAIARMILSDPDIIIFDEATSSLDSESEQKIQEAFWRVSHNKTTIIIAHRLSTIMKADKIVVIEDGQIKEMGSHRALMQQKKSLYRHFWKLQVTPI